MNTKTFLTIHSMVYASFAIVLFVMPALLWPMYGVEINDKYAYFLSQHNSIFLGGIAIIAYLFRDIEPNSLMARKLLMALGLTNMLGFFITLYACFNDIFVGFGWSDPIFFAVLAMLNFWQFKKNS